MRPSTIALPFVLATALVAWSAVPVGTAQSGDETAVPPRRARLGNVQGALVEELTEKVPGAWRLSEFRHATSVMFRPGDVRGFLIAADGHLSLVIRARVRDETGGNFEIVNQCETGRYRIDELGRLQIATSIGFSSMAETALFDTSFNAREFEAELIDDNTLELRRPDRTTFTFKRSSGSEFSEDLIDEIEKQRRFGNR